MTNGLRKMTIYLRKIANGLWKMTIYLRKIGSYLQKFEDGVSLTPIVKMSWLQIKVRLGDNWAQGYKKAAYLT